MYTKTIHQWMGTVRNGGIIMKNGIDISRHQGVIDWKLVKISNAVDFAIIRAGYGKSASQKDTMFERNYAGCRENNIPVGAYWYSYAASVEDAKKEAEVCISVLNGRKFEYPVYFDIEEQSQFKKGKAFCSDIVRVFLETIENAGYIGGIYASKSPLETYIDASLREKYTVWVAHYTTKTTYKGHDMWQKSASGKVAGISGYVDMDECYRDFTAENSTDKPTDTDAKTIEDLAQEVLEGKWGNGQERKDRLTAAGYDYANVQALVNTLVKASQRTHTVVKGDTLSAIAKKYGTTVEKILTDNKDTYPKMTADFIQTGWKLKV